MLSLEYPMTSRRRIGTMVAVAFLLATLGAGSSRLLEARLPLSSDSSPERPVGPVLPRVRIPPPAARERVSSLDRLEGRFFYESPRTSPDARTLPGIPGAGRETVFRLFDRVTSYRDDHKATFELTIPEPDGVTGASIVVTAYNDDPIYDRAVRFEIDGHGGYVGTRGVSAHVVSGDGVLGTKQTRTWRYDLAGLTVGRTLSEGRGPGETLSLLEVLRRPGTHKLSCWVSTYGQQGAGSTVTLDLRLRR